MLSTHVTTLEQSRKLYELGFRRDTTFVWENDIRGEWQIVPTTHMENIPYDWYEAYGAYLLSEIMEALPDEINNGYWIDCTKYEEGWQYYYSSQVLIPMKGSEFTNKNPVTAACDLLIWCRENGYINIDGEPLYSATHSEEASRNLMADGPMVFPKDTLENGFISTK